MLNQNKAEVAILISDIIDFRAKNIIRDKSKFRQFIRRIEQSHKPGVSNYMKQSLTELQREIDTSTIIVGYLNTSLSVVNRINRKSVGVRKSEQYYQ